MVQTDPQHTAPAAQGQVGKRIFRATGALMVIQIILRGFGLIEKSILGHVIGANFKTDAYNAAKDIAFYLFQMVDQVVMHSFLPVFVQRMRDQGEKQAWRLASTTINLLMLFMAVIALIGVVFTPHVLPLFLPDWFSGQKAIDPHQINQLVILTRMMLVSVVFLATSSLTYCLLNSYKQFALPASADLALKGTVLVFAVLFAGSWGPYALAVGFVFGSIAKIIVHSAGLGRRLANYRPTVHLKDPGLKQFALLALPLLAGVIFSIFRQVMDQRFTSSLSEGSLSALKYAKNLCDVPVSFFPFVFGIALFPFLADIAAAGDKIRLRSMLMSATRMMLLLFIPLTIAVIMLREPIVITLFSEKSILAATPLQVYALGMVIGALEIIVLQFYFAMSDTMRPTIIGMVMVPLHITVAYLCIYNWKIGVIGIPLALLISKGAKVAVLYGMIRRKLGRLEGGATVRLLAKIVVASLPLAVILLVAVTYLPDPGAVEGMKRKLLVLMPYGVAGGVGMLAYFMVLHFLRVDEVAVLASKVLGKISRKPASV